MGNILTQTKTDPRIFYSLGYFMLLISIVTSIFLFISFGHSLLEKAIYACIGFALSILGVIGLSSAVNFYLHSQYLGFLFGLLLWISQFIVAVSSHLGFLAISTQERAVNSDIAKSLTHNMHARQNNSNLAGYSGVDLASLKNDKLQLENKRTELNIQLAKCNKNYISACINPLKSQINDLDNKITELNQKESGFNQYQASLNRSNDAINQYAAIASGKSDLTAHPLFQNQAVLAEIKPSEMQALFLVFIAIIFELSTIFCFYCAKSHAVSDIIINSEYSTIQENKANNLDLEAFKSDILKLIKEQSLKEVDAEKKA